MKSGRRAPTPVGARAGCEDCREKTERSPQSRQAPPSAFVEPVVETLMTRWRLLVEPTLEDLLADEIMVPVLRRAGIDAAELREQLAEMARRLAKPKPPRSQPARTACRGDALYC